MNYRCPPQNDGASLVLSLSKDEDLTASPVLASSEAMAAASYFDKLSKRQRVFLASTQRILHLPGQATMVWVCSPNPSMPTLTTSPALRNTGVGLMPRPTPGGVPVRIRSPG